MGRSSQNPTDPFDRSSSSPLDRARSPRSDLSDRNRSQSTSVRIRLMMPVEVTPGIVEEVERDKARRELVSRVQGNRNAAMNDAIFFPAERQTVELSHDTIDLESIDCELLEQLSMARFPQARSQGDQPVARVRSARALVHQPVAHRGSPAAGRLAAARQAKEESRRFYKYPVNCGVAIQLSWRPSK